LSVAPLARVLSWSPLVFLGEISYGIYLVHVPVQMIAIAVARAHRFIIPASHPLWMACYAVAVITFATALRYLIEKPAMRWARRRFLSRDRAHHRPKPTCQFRRRPPGPRLGIRACGRGPVVASLSQ
jgi:peptidoglycan/LPS O-acetylase OafA/YrhL